MHPVIFPFVFALTKAFTVDLSAYEKYRAEAKASVEIEMNNILEMYLDNAGFEELMTEYGREVSEIYERNIEKAIQMKWLQIF